MNQNNFKRTQWNTPFIAQRADPYILQDNGVYYFTASIPAYDGIVLRRSDSLEGLRTASETEVWHKHESGIMSKHIWAPELHKIDGRWYIYFAAGERDDIWNIRPWVIRCESSDPLEGPWTECGNLKRADGDDFSFTDFSLDMTTFAHNGQRYCVWAEKVSVGRKISNLYIARMKDALTLDTPQMLLCAPTYDWERHGFWVNEGASFLHEAGKIFITYSASDTSPAYCMGMLWADENADPMDISAWHKMNKPVFGTNMDRGLLGPGHNTFFRDTDGNIYMSYHARNYDEIIGDPLYDPNRNAYVMLLPFKDGMPVFDTDNQLFQ